jgi:hypothetical protein
MYMIAVAAVCQVTYMHLTVATCKPANAAPVCCDGHLTGILYLYIFSKCIMPYRYSST